MVHIITGSINSGKTTKLLSIYNEIKTGDGFILPKVYVEGNYAGQQIVRLSNGASRPFSFKVEYMPTSWDEKYRYDAYSFSREGFNFAYAIAHDILSNDISPIFIDEVGPLELQEKGFFQLLTLLLQRNCIAYISIRETLLESVVRKFNIKDFDVI